MGAFKITYKGIELDCHYDSGGRKGCTFPRDPDGYYFNLESVSHKGEDISDLIDVGSWDDIETTLERAIDNHNDEMQTDWMISNLECFA